MVKAAKNGATKRNRISKVLFNPAAKSEDITEHKRAELLRVEQNRLLEMIARGTPAEECLIERKQAEETLWANEKRLRAMFEQAATGIVVVDLAGRLLEVNNRMSQIVGRPREQLLNLSCADLTHPDDWNCNEVMMEEVAAGKRAEFVIEKRYSRQDGSWVWVNVTVSPLLDENGRPQFLLAMVQDIDARKKAEESLSESEERFRAVADNIAQLAWICDRMGEVIWYNQRWLDYTGLSFEDMKGWGWTRCHHPDHVESVVASVQRSRDTATPWEHIFPLRGKDGNYRWFLSRATPIRDATGNIVRWFGTNTDVTEQREADEALRQSEERYRSLVSVITDVPWTTDATGAFITDQPAWAAYTGQSQEELRGFGWVNALHPDDRKAVAAIWKRACETRTVYESQGRVWHASTKRWRYFVARATPVFNEDRTVREWVGSCTDVDAQKRAEDKLQQLFVNEQALRGEAERASRMKDEFLATVSHELRTPLNAIMGWSHLLRSGTLDEAGRARALETIDRNAKTQAQLIEDILDVSRVITGKLRLNKEPIDMASIIAAAIDSMQAAAEAKDIQLEVTLESSVPAIAGDPNRLQQIVWNLVSNAVKFTPAGGRVQVRLERKSTSVQVVVRDTGEGIDLDFLPFVFDRFRQADGTLTRRHGGLGLGLAIVRHLVEVHGGEVFAESPGPNRGSTFTVRLPFEVTRTLNKDKNERKKISSSLKVSRNPLDASPRLDGVRILIVDDDSDTLQILRAVLSRFGANVEIATSVAGAMKVLRQSKPHVVVSDLAMPDEDGHSLIKKIRTGEAGNEKQIPALALTAHTRIEDRARALSAGFNMFVPKPVEPDELISAIANLVDARPGGM